MPQKFYSWFKKAALIIPILALGFSDAAKAQCEWLSYAPYIVQPATRYYQFPCGAGNHVWITKVTTTKGITNINNASSGCAPVGDTNNYNYFPQTLKANVGDKIDFSMTVAYSAGTDALSRSKIGLWVDWNHNGVFEETQSYTEMVPFESTGLLGMTQTGVVTAPPSNGAVTFSIKVPTYAKNGLTRMRVRVTATGVHPSFINSYAAACDYAKFGECEDYDFDVVAPCKAPKVISISNVTCNSADICWSPVDNADFYDYWVDTCKDPGCSIQPPLTPGPIYYFAPTGQNCVSLPNNKYPMLIPQLLSEKKYYVLVRSTCDSIRKPTWQYFQNSGWEAIDSFTTLPCCDAPKNVKITNITSTTGSASWDPVYTANMYEYTVMSTPNTPPSNATKINGTSVILQGLTSAKTYYFCVKALCSPTPQSGWTCVNFGTENTLSLSELEREGPSLSAYPNPVKNMVTISVSNAPAKGMLSVTDIAGRVVYSTAVAADKLDVNMSSWTSGLYLIKYTSDAGNRVIKVTKE